MFFGGLDIHTNMVWVLREIRRKKKKPLRQMMALRKSQIKSPKVEKGLLGNTSTFALVTKSEAVEFSSTGNSGTMQLVANDFVELYIITNYRAHLNGSTTYETSTSPLKANIKNNTYKYIRKTIINNNNPNHCHYSTMNISFLFFHSNI